jgi:PAS domain S-box-containing protein
VAVAIALLLAAATADAAPRRNLRFQRISLEQGLSQAVVTCSFQDRQGFMWFGTQEGLNRYDGYEFTVFVHQTSDPSSLASDLIKGIHEDRRGVLWVATDGGLERFDESRGAFTHFRHDPANPNSLSHDRVRVIVEGRDGELWLGTDGGGLDRFDPATGTFAHYRAVAGGLSHDNIRGLSQDAQGRLWIATEGGGLNLFDPDSGQFTTYRHDPADPASLSDDRVRTVYVDHEGIVWAGTYDGGLSRLDPAVGTFQRFQHDSADPGSLAANGVWAVYQDHAGELWIGTDGGLNRFLPANQSFERYVNDPADLLSLSHSRVTSIYQDSGGVFWIGTYGGLNKWNPVTQYFAHYEHRLNDLAELSNNYVTSFAEGLSGTVWVGTYGGGLNLLDREKGIFEHYRHDPDQPASLSDDRVMSLYVDPRGTLWVGTLSGGLNRFDEATGGFQHFRHDAADATSLSGDGVTDILEAADGAFWVGTYGGGLNRFWPSRGQFDRYLPDPQVPGSLSSDRVIKLFQDRSGDLWVGTDGGGLNLFDPASGRFTPFRHDPDDPASLSSDVPWALYEDEAGSLWIATQGGGLNRWDAADRRVRRGRFHRITREQGLLSDIVYGIIPDGEGNLWLSTNRGLSEFDPRLGSFLHYDVSNGLQSNEFNYRAEMRARDGEVFFGGIQGFNSFHPDEIPRNEHTPPVVLTRVLKFNHPVDFGRPLAGLDELVLGYQDYVVAFEFAALDFAAPEKNKYLHKLEGFDQDWVDSSSQRRATYTNLKAGRYTFRVRAANNDGVWNEAGLALPVRALAPPWLTRGAYSLYALLAGLAILAFVRSQVRKRRYAQELARTNETLTEEIARRRAKELDLEREKERAQSYFDVAEVLMLVLNPSGEVELINQKGCRVLGYDEEEIVGKNWLECFVPAAQQKEVRTYLASHDPQEYFEYSVIARGGEERIIAWQITPLTDQGGDPGGTQGGIVTGTLSSGSDITQMRQLKEAKESAELASRTKSQFLANMSHEIRTPMNGVLGMIELLLKSELSGRQQGFAETARRSALHLLDILNDILDFSKIEAGKLELESVEFDLHELVEDVVALFAERFYRKRLELITSLPDDLPPVLRGDPTRLRQILSNLLGNAVKFTDAGEVEVSIPQVVAEGDGITARIAVRDTGIGLEPEVRGRIFDSFHQGDGSTTRKYGGTGLGLAISRQLVELMGGEMGVESEGGQGSTFWFRVRLGLATGPSAATAPALRTFTVDVPRLLVVDDNATCREMLRRQVERWGIQAEVAAGVGEALDKLRAATAASTPFGLAVLDLDLAGESGLDLAQALRADPKIRALNSVILAAGELPDGEELSRAGVHASLAKPVRMGELYNWLASLLTPSLLPERAPTLGGGRAKVLTSYRILLAEDSEVNQQLLQSMIEMMGGEVEVVDNGREAVTAAESGIYDAVLMDCQMPREDGYAATRRIRAAERARANGGGRRSLPIIAMTANAMAGDREKCLAAGMDDYLSKPFTQAQLVERLLRWLPPPAADAAKAAKAATTNGGAGADGEDLLLPPPEVEAPTLSLRVFDNIRSLEEQGAVGLLGRLVCTYLRTAPQLIANLQRAAQERDVEGIERAAHTLKSSSAQLGAVRLSVLCGHLQQRARRSGIGDVEQLCTLVAGEYEQVQSALTPYAGEGRS